MTEEPNKIEQIQYNYNNYNSIDNYNSETGGSVNSGLPTFYFATTIAFLLMMIDWKQSAIPFYLNSPINVGIFEKVDE